MMVTYREMTTSGEHIHTPTINSNLILILTVQITSKVNEALEFASSTLVGA